MDWKDIIKTVAPTVASALGGPLAGVAVSAIGSALGVDDATQDKIKSAIEQGQMTGEQIAALKTKEQEFQNEEKERGFRYAELEFKDRDSARKASVDGGTAKMLFGLSILLLLLTLGAELVVLFNGYPKSVPEIIVGRVLGLMDAIAMTVLAFHYGSSAGSDRKTALLAQGGQGK